MKIPVWLASIIVTAAFASQGWLIMAVIDLKTDVAALKAATPQTTRN
ncbi:MAG: hypothetical protein PHY43_03880 [Verrucomicrobiales bacterium]|nr:hypothetical protein [Verrucomicrobiales bacterium]